MAGTRKRDLSGHAHFCHPECYFGSKIPHANKNLHQDEPVHGQEDAIYHATEVSARIARILLSRQSFFPWQSFLSIGMCSRYPCRRCAFRRFNSSLFSGILFGGRPSGLPTKRMVVHRVIMRQFSNLQTLQNLMEKTFDRACWKFPERVSGSMPYSDLK